MKYYFHPLQILFRKNLCIKLRNVFDIMLKNSSSSSACYKNLNMAISCCCDLRSDFFLHFSFIFFKPGSTPIIKPIDCENSAALSNCADDLYPRELCSLLFQIAIKKTLYHYSHSKNKPYSRIVSSIVNFLSW